MISVRIASLWLRVTSLKPTVL